MVRTAAVRRSQTADGADCVGQVWVYSAASLDLGGPDGLCAEAVRAAARSEKQSERLLYEDRRNL